jgi:molecular chaperone GrpE
MKNSATKQLEKKIKTLNEKLEAEQEKSNQYLTQLKYLQADFENYRKRTEMAVQEAVSSSNERLVSCLIDVLDDLEYAISAGAATENKGAMLDGIRMIHKNLDKILEKEGLERLECVGCHFDPNLHEILTQVPSKEHESGTIIEEARKGFLFKGKIIRPSVVKIACEASESDENE